jgi:hypothetical protein
MRGLLVPDPFIEEALVLEPSLQPFKVLYYLACQMHGASSTWNGFSSAF